MTSLILIALLTVNPIAAHLLSLNSDTYHHVNVNSLETLEPNSHTWMTNWRPLDRLFNRLEIQEFSTIIDRNIFEKVTSITS